MTAERIPPRYWRHNGQWACARPLPPPYPRFAKDWWKRSGLRGFGSTKDQALSDLQSWERAADFVSDIY